MLMKPLHSGQAPRTTFLVKDLLYVPRTIYRILTKTLSLIKGHNSEEEEVVGIMKNLLFNIIHGIPINYHYCRMLLTRHYNQRPFDETVCDAIIANSGVKNRQKRCKMFVMMDASNMVQIFVACAIQGIRFSSINCLRWWGTKEMGCQMKACAMCSIRFTRMNSLWWGGTTETGSQMKVCAIYDIQFTRMNCLRWAKRT